MSDHHSGPESPADALARLGAEHAGEPRRVVVAYSGGRDSTLLLALVAERWPHRRVRAIHVHHGWHADADEWAEHCRSFARSLKVHYEVVNVDARPRNGEGPEAGARVARYEALADRVGPGDVLLTAHHREDQAESLLLALLRGGGVHGLAAMPVCRSLGRGLHLRPWLDMSREIIAAEIESRGLTYLNDPANEDRAHDRVWLRREILPALADRWPRIDSTLARAAGLAASAATAVDTLAARDYVTCRGAVDGTIDRAALANLPVARQCALLRWWIARAGLTRPPARRLATLRHQLTEAAPNGTPHIDWPGGEVRGWRGAAWALTPKPPIDPDAEYPWADRGFPLELPDRRLTPEQFDALGLSVPADARVRIRFRRGGERFRPAGAARAEPLKELLRRAGVPPWERERVPLIYVDGELAAVMGLGPAHRDHSP